METENRCCLSQVCTCKSVAACLGICMVHVLCKCGTYVCKQCGTRASGTNVARAQCICCLAAVRCAKCKVHMLQPLERPSANVCCRGTPCWKDVRLAHATSNAHACSAPCRRGFAGTTIMHCALCSCAMRTHAMKPCSSKACYAFQCTDCRDYSPSWGPRSSADSGGCAPRRRTCCQCRPLPLRGDLMLK